MSAPAQPGQARVASLAATARTAWPLLRLLGTAAVCALAWTWLMRHADLRLLQDQAGRLPAGAWVSAAAALLGGHAMRAWRLQRDWRESAHAPFSECLRIVLLHNALVIALPLRSGEVGYLVAVQRRWRVGLRAAGLALLRWRLQDAAVLLVLAVLLLAPLAPALRAAAAVGCAVLLHVALRAAWAWLLARAGAGAGVLPAGPSPWNGLGASVANWGLKVLANGGLLAALAGLPWLPGWQGALGGELAGVQPLQPPAGLGTYEAGVWLAAGAPPDAAALVAAAIAVHAFSLAVALGAAALVQLAVGRPRAGEGIR
ncbi:hypothetical protein PE066_05355 [Ramlibacter tataouinensis]|uniref:hypothetical protein n=1 Tax=Ramlibacter tataouinensis TaxID=94132 RepID=UPI0022F386A7|nr:hypothetical protein [Ramlibacter tataouinensis]WBY02964.1 hypothetical protein PE066_05355 [Ramlibacter tataouinensis]